MNFLPISISIAHRRIVIVGGGRVGLHKATILSRYTDATTDVRIISPKFREGFEALPFARVKKRYDAEDVDGAFLVYVCTEDSELNARVKRDCEERGVLCSVCDNPALCDFISPAIYRDENLTVAVSSDARDVRRSIRVRDNIRQAFDNGTISAL